MDSSNHICYLRHAFALDDQRVKVSQSVHMADDPASSSLSKRAGTCLRGASPTHPRRKETRAGLLVAIRRQLCMYQSFGETQGDSLAIGTQRLGNIVTTSVSTSFRPKVIVH